MTPQKFLVVNTTTGQLQRQNGTQTFADFVNEIHGMFIWFNPGTFDIDNVRAE